MKHAHFLMACVLSGATVLPVSAAPDHEIAHQAFAASHEDGSVRMTLRGTSLLRVGMIFKVYAAGLFVAEAEDTQRVLDDVPKRLEIAYLRHVRARDIVSAGQDILRRNLPPDEWARLEPRVTEIGRLYTDVKRGDRYALTYVPGRGSTLSLNGRDLVTIPGADFARAYFGIWLDARTDYPDFQARLLGRSP